MILVLEYCWNCCIPFLDLLSSSVGLVITRSVFFWKGCNMLCFHFIERRMHMACIQNHHRLKKEATFLECTRWTKFGCWSSMSGCFSSPVWALPRESLTNISFRGNSLWRWQHDFALPHWLDEFWLAFVEQALGIESWQQHIYCLYVFTWDPAAWHESHYT